MNWINYDDILSQLVAAGFDVSMPEVGSMRRAKVEGCAQKGWYSLHEVTLDSGELALIGAYGWWKGAEKFQQNFDLRVNAVKRKLSADQIAAFRKRMAEEAKRAKASREADARRAADEAMRVWAKYVPDGHCDYLDRKGVKAHGLRFDPGGFGTAAVPMLDASGRLWGLQILRGKNRGIKLEKQYFPKGVEVRGHFHLIGHIGAVILVAEGYATAATLHEATGLPVAVAFDSGNLQPVAEALHKAHRRAKILICADDDYLTGDAGVKKAEAAALAVGGAWIKPDFTGPDGQDRRDGKKLTDFNDLAFLIAPAAVAAQIGARLDALQWRMDPPAPAIFDQGGGEGRRPAAQSVMALDDLVARFIPLDDGTGKLVFDTWTNKPAQREQINALLPAGVRGDDLKRHPVWVQRGAYYLDEVGFDPGANDRDVKLNTWRGWPMEPKAGSCDRQLELLRYLCSGDPNGDALFHYLLCWMAYPLQNPGGKMNSAVIIHGPSGTGKSTVFKSLAKIYGAGSMRDYSVILDQRALQDNFNADWENKLYVLTEEAVSNSDKWNIKNELKELITGPFLRIRKVFTDAYRQRNQINLVFISNEAMPLPLDNDDRRHLVIYTPPQLPEDYYAEVYDEINSGGVEALYDHLLKVDLTAFDPSRRPPMTEAKKALILLSSPSELRFMHEWGSGELDLPVCPALAADVYTAYQRWCRNNGETRPRPSNHFHGAVARMAGWSKKNERYLPDYRDGAESIVKAIITPPANLITRKDLQFVEGTSRAAWFRDGVLAFAEALSGADKQWSAQ